MYQACQEQVIVEPGSLYPSGTRSSDAKLWVLWLHQKTWSSVSDAAWVVGGPGWQDQVVQNGPLKSYSLAPRLGSILSAS